jgi:hypothetical protein
VLISAFDLPFVMLSLLLGLLDLLFGVPFD